MDILSDKQVVDGRLESVQLGENAKTFNELKAGFLNWRFWGYLAWQDIRLRYRRSTLGPFWVTISMAIFVLALGTIYGHLFKMNIAAYLPYLTSGYLTWFYISVIINEGCLTFTEADGFLKDVRLPHSLFAARLVYRNFIVFLHNLVVFIVVALLFKISFTPYTLLVIPGLFFLMVNAAWITMFLGMFGARYRDIAPVVQSLVQVAFFVSPIVWMPHSLNGNAQFIVKYNLINYFLSAVREPLLGQAPVPNVWLVLTVTTVVGWLVTFYIYRLKRNRLVYWL